MSRWSPGPLRIRLARRVARWVARGADRRVAARPERGAATAELAVALPLLVAVTVGLVWLLALGTAQVRVVDAARETARGLARGDARSAATQRGLEVAPDGARVVVAATGEEVRVTVSARIAGPGGLFSHLGSATVSSVAVAAVEEGG